MISQALLRSIMWAEVWLLAVSLTLFVAHGVRLFMRERRAKREIAIGRPILAQLLSAATPRPSDSTRIAQLKRLSSAGVEDLILEISINISGGAQTTLRLVASEVGVTARARRMCRSATWSDRLRGARILTQLGEPDPVIVELLLGDSDAAVRAQAAEWAGSQPTPALVERMLLVLADPEAQSRFAVQDALARMGRIVVEPLARYLDGQAGFAAEAGLKVAETIPDPLFLGRALKFSMADSTRLRSAAAGLLAAIAGRDAAARLAEMLDDEDGMVRSSAARGLGRMRHWAAASKLSQTLNDPIWDARLDAGYALRAIGGPGVLLLRRAAQSSNHGAADIAQMILSLPISAR